MSADMAKVVDLQKQIMNLMREVQSLKKQNIEKDKTIKLLEHRVEWLAWSNMAE